MSPEPNVFFPQEPSAVVTRDRHGDMSRCQRVLRVGELCLRFLNDGTKGGVQLRHPLVSDVSTRWTDLSI
jgi:hypothetical protein